METIGVQVLQYLPESIQTFSSQSRRTVQSLIQSTKADKVQISNLVQNLRNLDLNANYSPALALRYSPMNLEAVIEFFRDSSLRVNQFFSAASSISNVINSMVSIFTSEIQKIEKDIYYLENFISNYQYISGEEDLFNFNYVENFDNDLNSHRREGTDIVLFDRDNILFNESGNYSVDNVLSKIKISNSHSFINVVNSHSFYEENNYSEFITTDTGFDATINSDPKDAWNVTVKAPFVLTSQLKDLSTYTNYDSSYIRGAQSKVVVSFDNDIETDFIRVIPNDSSGMQLLQVIILKADSNFSINSTSNNSGYIDFSVLNSPLDLSKPVDIVFEKSKVAKVTFIFNQSKYTRSTNTPHVHELNSKVLHEMVKKVRGRQSQNPSMLQDIVYNYYKKSTDLKQAVKNKKLYTEVYSYRYPTESLIKKNDVTEKILSYQETEIGSTFSQIIEDGNRSIISNIVFSIVNHALGSRANLFNNKIGRSASIDSFDNLANTLNTDGIIPISNINDYYSVMFQKEDPSAPGINSLDITKYLNSREKENLYEYSFSVKEISFGISETVTQNKACFISSKIETDGQPIAVKGIVNIVKERKDLSYSNYDLSEPGSYELSVTAKEDIQSEEDWIPLLASIDNYIKSEVLFFNYNAAKLRFYPELNGIKVYKNGFLESQNNWQYSRITNSISYNSDIDTSAVYVVEYAVDNGYGNQSIIDLDAIYGSSLASKKYSQNGSSGEKFSSTISGNKVTLSYLPLVEDKFSSSVYNDRYGTVISGTNAGYSPVTVTLDDGTPAINLTNYSGNSFVKGSFYDTTSYLFFHNGKELIFNKKIDVPFTVNYSYIPASLRFRLILRNNLPNQTNGISVDNVIVKSKVKNLDPFSKKLLRLN